jgi:micrococcal nuclease
MGEIIQFRRKRRWTRPEDYGHDPGKGSKPPKPPRRSRWLSGWRPWILLTTLVTLFVLYDPALVEPPAFLSTEPEKVEGSFTRCGPGRGTFCVVDGDTFKLGDRSIRIIGIDAPEMHPPRCDAEAKKGEAATAELHRLLNQGAFTMTGRIDEPQDKYGRDLRALARKRPDGTTQSIAADMLDSGTVRRYIGGLRNEWC